MSPEEKKRILAKIAKCMALGQSPEPHEAAAALQQASRLMEKYQLSEAEVRMADVTERKASAGRAADIPPRWLASLATVVASAFGVERFYQPRGWSTANMVFIGVEPAPAIAEYTFTVLRRKCEAARAAYYKSRRGKKGGRVARADAYAMGWVGAVEFKVRAFARRAPAVVGEYLQHYHPEIVKVRPIDRSPRQGLEHQIAGYLDGQGVELQHGVDGRAVKQIGG